jgi:hypothetical protein
LWLLLSQDQKECDFYWLSVVKDKLCKPGTEDELEENIQNVVNNEQCHTIITPTKCTLLLLKAPDITICTLCHYVLPLHVSTRVGHLQGAQCQCLAKVIINYNLLKLR